MEQAVADEQVSGIGAGRLQPLGQAAGGVDVIDLGLQAKPRFLYPHHRRDIAGQAAQELGVRPAGLGRLGRQLGVVPQQVS